MVYIVFTVLGGAEAGLAEAGAGRGDAGGGVYGVITTGAMFPLLCMPRWFFPGALFFSFSKVVSLFNDTGHYW